VNVMVGFPENDQVLCDLPTEIAMQRCPAAVKLPSIVSNKAFT
jgi:hypothetical protein